MNENSQNLAKDTNLQIQEAKKIPVGYTTPTKKILEDTP